MSRSQSSGLSWVCAILILAPSMISAANTVLKSFPLKASQGVAVDEKYLYAISNTEIRKHDKETGKEIAAWKAETKLPEFRHFLHMNSGTVIAGKLYCAHSRFPLAPNECTVEVWDVEGEKLKHVETIHMPATHGSLTWIDRRGDGSWWLCYAVYGEGKNKATKLIKCRYEDGKFIEQGGYLFPREVVAQWGAMSCSGGSWGPDDLLYTTICSASVRMRTMAKWVVTKGRNQNMKNSGHRPNSEITNSMVMVNAITRNHTAGASFNFAL